MDKGAVENWLVNVFLESRKIRPEWKWTFYCILGREGRLDKKVRDAGAEIIYSPVTVSKKITFLRSLRKTLKAGKYDIIHSHHDYLSGFYLLSSLGIKFRKRILHIHNTDKALPVGNDLLRKVLLSPFRRFSFLFSNIIVGISNDTLHQFVDGIKNRKVASKVLYYGIDMDLFEKHVEPSAFRHLLDIPVAAKIMLFVGRMNNQKNPLFVVDILSEILKSRNDIYAVFVGKGDLSRDIREKAALLKADSHVRIADWLDDVASVMKSSDVFVFPRVEHPKEGLGLVVIEAQSAGLPMLITKGIVEDAIIVHELCSIKSLSNPVQSWAEAVTKIIDNGSKVSREEALERMKHSHFNLEIAARNVVDLYES